MSASVFAFISVFLFMPAVSLGAGVHDAPQLENQQSLFVCEEAVAHATHAVDLAMEGFVVDAARQTGKAVNVVEQAIAQLPSRSRVHRRLAVEYLRASKRHLKTALQHWARGDLEQARQGAMLGRDYAEASIRFCMSSANTFSAVETGNCLCPPEGSHPCQ